MFLNFSKTFGTHEFFYSANSLTLNTVCIEGIVYRDNSSAVIFCFVFSCFFELDMFNYLFVIIVKCDVDNSRFCDKIK